MTVLTDHELAYIGELIHTSAALVLKSGKGYLVESRLGPIAREKGLTLSGLIQRLRHEPYGVLHHRVVEAMTTNETSWFRDVHPFDALRTTVIPDLIERRKAERSLTIWSAACSTGQEPYSVAMVLLDDFPELADWNVTIWASDFSEEAVAKARAGRYSQLEVNRGLPAQHLVRHFEREDAHFVVRSHVRSRVQFGVVNLIGPWNQIPRLDVMMLRNVMIYFDADTKRQILDRVRQQLRPDGYLFLGNAESTIHLDDRFVRVEPNRAGCHRLRSFVEQSLAASSHTPAAS